MVLVGQTVSSEARVLKARASVGLGWTSRLMEGFRLQRPFDGMSETFTEREAARASRPVAVQRNVESKLNPSYEDLRK